LNQEILHLALPHDGARTYGSLVFRGSESTNGIWAIEAEPAVRAFARRVFPGCSASGDILTFTTGRRQVENLLWLMLRYPLEMDEHTISMLHRTREGAIDLAMGRTQRVERRANPGSMFDGELKPFQETGVGFMLDNPKSVLGDDMGLGKTVQAIAAMTKVNRWPAVVVVPNSVTRQWPKMIEKFTKPGIGQEPYLITGTKPKGAMPQAPIYIIGYHLLRFWIDRLIELDPQVIVFDECQELRRGESQKYGAASRLSDGCEYVWGLSGTPIYNYGDEIWWVMHAIESHCLGSLASFTREWCAGTGSRMVTKPDVLGDYMKTEGLLIRRVKSDVQSQLPPKRQVVHRIEHDGKKFGEMIQNAVSIANRYDSIQDRFERGRAIREMETETRKATGVSKAPYVADFVLSLLDAGERPVVYAHHHDVHDEILDKIKKRDNQSSSDKYSPVAISGRQSAKQKEDAIRAFAEGESKCAVVALRTAAGIDGLQGSGTVVVFAELDWSPAIHSQCEDRLHRIGMDEGSESLLCYYLASEVGTDDTMLTTLGLKVGQFVGLMGDKEKTIEDQEQAMVQAEKHMESVIDRLRAQKKPRRRKAAV